MAPASPASQEAARAGSLLWFRASLPQGPNYGTRSITVHLLSEPQFLGDWIGSIVGNKTLLDQRPGMVAKSLHGDWDEALLFALKVALETCRFNQTTIQECDCCIHHHLGSVSCTDPHYRIMKIGIAL
jgi:hypothetical protein